MPRCVICDYSDDAGSLSNVTHHGRLIWSDYWDGYVCAKEAFPQEEDDEQDDIWETDIDVSRRGRLEDL